MSHAVPHDVDNEGRDSEACRVVNRRVLADPDLWALVALLLVLAALLA